MGTELAKHLIANNDYEVRVWNRTLDKTTPLVDADATTISPQDAEEFATTVPTYIACPVVGTLDLLDATGLSFMANLKRDFVLGDRSTDPGDFTVDALCTDSKLMLDTAGQVLPGIQAAQDHGRGDHDFSAILVHRSE